MPLRDALDCVHLHNENLHRGLLSLRGLLVRPTLLGVSILVSLSVFWLWLKNFVTFTRYVSSRVLMTSSLSGHRHLLRNRLRLRVSFLTLLSCIARGLRFPRFWILLISLSAGCGIPSSLSFFAVFRLSAKCGFFRAPSLFPCDASSFCCMRIRLCWPGFVPRCRRAYLGGAFLPIPRLPILAMWSFSRFLPLSLNLVSCRLEISNILPGDCAAVCSKSASSGDWGAVCSRLGFGTLGTLLRVIVWATPQRFLCDLDLFQKLRHVEEFLGCPHFTWDTFWENSRCKFCGFSHWNHTLLVQLSVSVWFQRL